MTTPDVTERRRAALDALRAMEAGVTVACVKSPAQEATIVPRSDPDHFHTILDELAVLASLLM
jgi:hypothetical protein